MMVTAIPRSLFGPVVLRSQAVLTRGFVAGFPRHVGGLYGDSITGNAGP